jgi:hypothetical protein
MNVDAADFAAAILVGFTSVPVILPDRSITSTTSIGSGCIAYPSPFSRMVTSTVSFTATVWLMALVPTER